MIYLDHFCIRFGPAAIMSMLHGLSYQDSSQTVIRVSRNVFKKSLKSSRSSHSLCFWFHFTCASRIDIRLTVHLMCLFLMYRYYMNAALFLI